MVVATRGRIVAALAAILMAAGGGCTPQRATGDEATSTTSSAEAHRIVSMAPSLTETVFALGLGDAVVGVTRFCDTPPCARSRTSVGGYLDPSYEAIVGLEPDLVLLMQDHAEVEHRLSGLGIRSVRVDQSRVAGILRSFEEIATAAGAPGRGRTLAAAVRRRLDAVADSHPEPRPSVLVVVGREVGAGTVNSVWVAGPETTVAVGDKVVTGVGMEMKVIASVVTPGTVSLRVNNRSDSHSSY